MSYPPVFNDKIKSLADYEPKEHTLGRFLENACDPTYNLVESDLNTTQKQSISFGIPLNA